MRLSSFEVNAYDNDDVRLTDSIGVQIAGAIANAQMYADLKRAEELERRRHELEIRYTPPESFPNQTDLNPS